MKVYLSGVNVVVDRGAPYEVINIPQSDSRVLNFTGDHIGIFDERTQQTYIETYDQIFDEGGAPWGATKEDVIDALEVFVGDPTAGGGGGGVDKFIDLKDIDMAGVRNNSHWIYDAAQQKLKPTNEVSETKRFDASADIVFYQDEYCEIRWNIAGQPQFRIKGNWGWFDSSMDLILGNSSTKRAVAGDVTTWNDVVNWSPWFWFTNGSYSNQYDFGFWGAIAYCSIAKEDDVSGSAIPTYWIRLIRGASNSMTSQVKRIVT